MLAAIGADLRRFLDAILFVIARLFIISVVDDLLVVRMLC